jgi:hypothetical protein
MLTRTMSSTRMSGMSCYWLLSGLFGGRNKSSTCVNAFSAVACFYLVYFVGISTRLTALSGFRMVGSDQDVGYS